MNKWFLLVVSAVISLNLNASLSNVSQLPTEVGKTDLIEEVEVGTEEATKFAEKEALIRKYMQEIRALAFKAAFAEAEKNKPSILDAYLKEVEAACNGITKEEAGYFRNTPMVSHFPECEAKYGFVNEVVKYPGGSFCQAFQEALTAHNQQ